MSFFTGSFKLHMNIVKVTHILTPDLMLQTWRGYSDSRLLMGLGMSSTKQTENGTDSKDYPIVIWS